MCRLPQTKQENHISALDTLIEQENHVSALCTLIAHESSTGIHLCMVQNSVDRRRRCMPSPHTFLTHKETARSSGEFGRLKMMEIILTYLDSAGNTPTVTLLPYFVFVLLSGLTVPQLTSFLSLKLRVMEACASRSPLWDRK